MTSLFPAFMDEFIGSQKDLGHIDCIFCKQSRNLARWIAARRVFTPAILAIFVESANDPRCKISK